MEGSRIEVGTVFKLGYPFDDWDEDYRVIKVEGGMVEVTWDDKHEDEVPAIYSLEDATLYLINGNWIKVDKND